MERDIDNISDLLSSIDIHKQCLNIDGNSLFNELMYTRQSLEEAHIVIAQLEEKSDYKIKELESKLTESQNEVNQMVVEIELLSARLEKCIIENNLLKRENEELSIMYEVAQYNCDSKPY